MDVDFNLTNISTKLGFSTEGVFLKSRTCYLNHENLIYKNESQTCMPSRIAENLRQVKLLYPRNAVSAASVLYSANQGKTEVLLVLLKTVPQHVVPVKSWNLVSVNYYPAKQ